MPELFITREISEALLANAIRVGQGHYSAGRETFFESPCVLSGFDFPVNGLMGAFSYSWSRLVGVRSVGRYCSISTDVIFGVTEHPTQWLSSSSFTYDHQFFWGGFTHERGSSFQTVPLPDETKRGSVTIGNDVWIGTRAYVRGGIAIGDGAIIGAYAVVTKDVPPYAVVVGNPAKIVKMRFSNKIIDDLQKSKWWDYAYTDFAGLDFRNVPNFLELLREKVESGLLEKYIAPRVDIVALVSSMQAKD
jgi:acetyltransferase-like isoleucine patch superfamily enzyme